MNQQLVASYPTVNVEGLSIKDFLDKRIVDLEKSLLTCNPRVAHLIRSSIVTNILMSISLGTFNQGH